MDSLKNFLTEVADEIRVKRRIEDKIVANDFASEIGSIEVAEGPISKDVDFIDYDGTLLYSYTLAEIQAMTELPPLPTQPGLICQEWNWSLEDIKAFGRRLIVGATYITDDGKTRIYIDLTSEDRLDMPLYINQTITNGTEIDWGDGSPIETSRIGGSHLITHRYENKGTYVITLNSINGSVLSIGSGTSSTNITGTNTNPGRTRYGYANAITKINIGKDISSLNYTFNNCYRLTEITIPNTCNIGFGVFNYCHSLKTVIVPNGVTSIGNNAFGGNCGIYKISLPNTLTNIDGSSYSSCYNLQEIIIPDNVTSIGTSAFGNCYSLKELIIPKNLKVIGSISQNCYNIKKLVIPNGVTDINASFANYYYIKEIMIPDSVVFISNMFYGWSSLNELLIPDSVTSIASQICSDCKSLTKLILSKNITNIPSKAFYNCYSLVNVYIPSGVTNIASQAFYSCYSMTKYDFSEHTQVPTMENTNVFTYIPSDCQIIVPDTLYDEWIAATNWANYADYIIKVSEVEV